MFFTKVVLLTVLLLSVVVLVKSVKVSSQQTQEVTRTGEADGGEGEYGQVCVLEGYYEFLAQSTSIASGCSSFPSTAQMLAHFYVKDGACVADVAFTSWAESWCLSALPASSAVLGSITQTFDGSVILLSSPVTPVTITIQVVALSQSQPYAAVTTGCCQSGTQMVGTPAEDVNVVGLRNCAITQALSSCNG